MALTCTYGAHAQVRTHEAGHNEVRMRRGVPPFRGGPGVRSVRALYRCTNPECRLQGYRVWVDAGTPWACDCAGPSAVPEAEPGTASATARKHLAIAREALGRAKP